MLGVELVKDRGTKAPAKEETVEVINSSQLFHAQVLYVVQWSSILSIPEPADVICSLCTELNLEASPLAKF